MKNLIKHLTFLTIIISFLTCSIFNIYATETSDDFDHTENGSITVDYRHDDTALDDVEFKVYHITELDENGDHILLDNFEDFDVDFESLFATENWTQFRDNLDNYINYEMLTPEKTFITDGYGQYALEDLDLGIYFIQAETIEKDGIEFFSEPILILVGTYDDSDEKWLYHYTVQPKISVMGAESYNLTVTKVWENTSSDLLIPDEIEIEIHHDGEVFDTVILSEANAWTFTWYDIEPCDCWAIKEITELEDFEVNYSKNLFEFTVTNTYVGEPEEYLPQTGSYAYLIPICSGLGLIFLLMGVLLKHKFRCKNHD